MNYKYFPILLLILNACQPANDCQDIDYGATAFQATTHSPWPYKGGEILVFKDSLNHELKFHMTPYPTFTKTWLHFNEPMQLGDCAGEAGIKGYLEFFETKFESDSLSYKMRCYYEVRQKMVDDKPIFYESMWTSIAGKGYPSPWYVSFSHITNYRGNEAYLDNELQSFVLEEHTTLRGKVYDNVYHSEGITGGLLYFNHQFGYIAFKESGKPLWVLDRIE